MRRSVADIGMSGQGVLEVLISFGKACGKRGVVCDVRGAGDVCLDGSGSGGVVCVAVDSREDEVGWWWRVKRSFSKGSWIRQRASLRWVVRPCKDPARASSRRVSRGSGARWRKSSSEAKGRSLRCARMRCASVALSPEMRLRPRRTVESSMTEQVHSEWRTDGARMRTP